MIVHRDLRTNGVTLRVATAGPVDGPMLILLHGFPEGWFAWRDYLGPFAEAGYFVVAPDQRGYGDSDKPSRVADYAMDLLAADVIGLIDGAARKKAVVVGHDWGAAVAWWTAVRHADRVERLAVLNVPHPLVMRDFLLKNPSQLRKSWYMLFFQIPWMPDWLLRRGQGRAFLRSLQDIARPGTFDDDMQRRLLESWSKPGAMTAMLNWYRAAIRQALRPPNLDPIVKPKTLVLWGKQDALLTPELAEASLVHCEDGRIEWFEDAGHFVNHEERDRVIASLLGFLDSKST